jgi:broad specificity phosphatase PhoE
MRALEFRRHTASDGDVLTPEGIEAARAIGQRLTGPYHVMVSTGAQRATQTLACMLAAMQPQPGRVGVDERFRSEVEDEWRAAYAEAGAGDLASFLRVAPDLVESEAKRFGEAARDLLSQLGEGERALVVGHSPMHEATVYGLTGTIVGPLAKGGAVVILETEGNLRIEHLDP